MRLPAGVLGAALCVLTQWAGRAQTIAHEGMVHAHLAIATPAGAHDQHHLRGATAPPAVLWLTPVSPEGDAVFAAWKPRDGYRLLQKDKTFRPHLLVVPIGSTVSFPNADPFFHNVFSLFNGKRFDLGLYEAGSSKNVTFSRQGRRTFSATSTLK